MEAMSSGEFLAALESLKGGIVTGEVLDESFDRAR
jgi:hypothetical protein